MELVLWRSAPPPSRHSSLFASRSLQRLLRRSFFPPLSLRHRHRCFNRFLRVGQPGFVAAAGGGGGVGVRCFAAAAAVQDAGATALVLAGAYALVFTFDRLTDRRVIEKSVSRKVVHVLSGILFMCSWPIFSQTTEARFFAAVVPLINCLRLLMYGLCLVNDEALIKSVTREGKPVELLRGPLYYVLVLLFCALFFWRESPVGVVSLAMMSGGDGFADIVGRRFGSIKLPYNSKKSWIGSFAMCTFGFLFSIGMLYYFSCFGLIHIDWSRAVQKVALISFVATVVESLPVTDVLDDNLAVPLSSMLMALMVFGI